MPECSCAIIVGSHGRRIGDTIDPRCQLHGQNAAAPRDLRSIGQEMQGIGMVMAAFGSGTAPALKARMREICREYIAATEEGADG